VNFYHFANIRKAININKRFLKNFYTFFFLPNGIILQWVLGLVAKIKKYLNKFVLPYMAYNQTWLNFFMDDHEKDYKIEKIKRLKKSLMSLLLSPFIIH